MRCAHFCAHRAHCAPVHICAVSRSEREDQSKTISFYSPRVFHVSLCITGASPLWLSTPERERGRIATPLKGISFAHHQGSHSLSISTSYLTIGLSGRKPSDPASLAPRAAPSDGTSIVSLTVDPTVDFDEGLDFWGEISYLYRARL